MRRRLLAAATLVAATLCAGVPVAVAAEAATITAVGWWTQRPGAGELPAGGFEVALFPNGPVSIAALRVDVKTAPITNALLELTEAEQVLGDVARVQACPTKEQWTPANPGAWSEAPTPACEGAAVALGRNTDGSWTGDVESLLRGGSTSIVLVPSQELSDQQQSVTFQLTFAGARLVASSPAGSNPDQDPTPPPFGAPPVIAEPSVPSAPVEPVPVPAAPTAPVPAATPAAAANAFAGTSAEADTEGKPWWRLLFGVPLAVAAGFAAVYARRQLIQRGVLGG